MLTWRSSRRDIRGSVEAPCGCERASQGSIRGTCRGRVLPTHHHTPGLLHPPAVQGVDVVTVGDAILGAHLPVPPWSPLGRPPSWTGSRAHGYTKGPAC